MSFDPSPIVQPSDGSLIIPAIKSPNFVAGQSGWIIRKDGTSEFQSVNLRGDLTVTALNGQQTAMSLRQYMNERINALNNLDTMKPLAANKTVTFAAPQLMTDLRLSIGSLFGNGYIFAEQDSLLLKVDLDVDASCQTTGSYLIIECWVTELKSGQQTLQPAQLVWLPPGTNTGRVPLHKSWILTLLGGLTPLGLGSGFDQYQIDINARVLATGTTSFTVIALHTQVCYSVLGSLYGGS